MPTEIDFKPPPIRIGDPVLWSYGGTKAEAKCPGVVTQVGDRTIQVSYWGPGWAGAQTRDGVYHKDDPLRKKGDRHESGAWEYSPILQDIKDFEELLIMKNEKILSLEGRIDNLSDKLTKATEAGRALVKLTREEQKKLGRVPDAEEIKTDEPAAVTV